MKKFILLTGGTGFIGSQLAEKLLSNNENVILLKRSYSDIWRIEDFVDYYSNLKLVNIDDVDIKDVFDNYDIEGILHLATYYAKTHKSEDINDMINSNVTFPTDLLEYAVKNNTKYFINTGSFAEYSLKNLPISEKTDIIPNNLYASTKVAFENILNFYNVEYSINTNTLKLFTPYGPKDDENKIIPYLIVNSIKKNKFIVRSTSKKLDVIHVNDIIEAYKNTMKYIKKFENHENINIANGISHSIKEMYELIESRLGKTEVEFLESDLSEVRADIKKAKKLINWTPKVNLKEGLKITSDYYYRKYK